MPSPERIEYLKRLINGGGYQKTVDAYKLFNECYALLDLIDTEFRTDPMSVQCFDLRIVQRVHEAVVKLKEMRR